MPWTLLKKKEEKEKHQILGSPAFCVAQEPHSTCTVCSEIRTVPDNCNQLARALELHPFTQPLQAVDSSPWVPLPDFSSRYLYIRDATLEPRDYPQCSISNERASRGDRRTSSSPTTQTVQRPLPSTEHQPIHQVSPAECIREATEPWSSTRRHPRPARAVRHKQRLPSQSSCRHGPGICQCCDLVSRLSSPLSGSPVAAADTTCFRATQPPTGALEPARRAQLRVCHP